MTHHNYCLCLANSVPIHAGPAFNSMFACLNDTDYVIVRVFPSLNSSPGKPLLLQPEMTIPCPWVHMRRIIDLRSQPDSVSPVLINMEIKWHAGPAQCLCEHQAVFHRNNRIVAGVKNETARRVAVHMLFIGNLLDQ